MKHVNVRKWLKRHRLKCLFVVTIIVWILSLLFLTNPTSSVANKQVHRPVEDSMGFPQKNQKIIADSKLLAVVILQLSAVRSKNQMSRLKVIDHGWAQWTRLFPTKATVKSMIDIKVVAPVSIVDSSLSFSTIQSFPSVESVVPTPTPYHRLVHSLLKAIDFRSDTSSNAKWIILANDHSFIIPQNLRRFLSQPSLDSEKILYSGNKLGLHYNKGLLYFASGGAGAVLSHVTAKFIVLVWILLSEDLLLLKLMAPAKNPIISPSDKSSVRCLDNLVQLTAYADQDSMWDLSHIATLLRAWIDEEPAQPSPVMHSLCDNSISSDLLDTVTVVLSSSVSFAVKKDTSRGQFQVTLLHADPTAPQTKTNTTLTRAQLRKACLPVGKWGNDNPGILLANCLAKFVDHPFTPSWSADVSLSLLEERSREKPDVKQALHAERFNVYGPLRTILGDFDSWYVDAKKLFEDDIRSSNSSYSMFALAKDTISFHYVSEAESQLLYQLLGPVNSTSTLAAHKSSSSGNKNVVLMLCQSQIAVVSTSTSSTNSTTSTQKIESSAGGACSTWQDLLAVWPRTDAAAGDYSRHIASGARGEQEAKALHAFLSDIAYTMRS